MENKTREENGMQCFTDVQSLLNKYGKDDDLIDIYCFVNQSDSMINIEFTFAVDPIVPISQKQLEFIQKTCVKKTHETKARKDLSDDERQLILKCSYIDPRNHGLSI